MGLLIIDESKCKKDGICVAECPVAIIRQKDKESLPELVPGGMADVSLALSYLELVAQTKGIGTCWAGIIHMGLQTNKSLQEAVGLPEGHVHHYAMMLGYAKPRYYRLPERKLPKIHWK